MQARLRRLCWLLLCLLGAAAPACQGCPVPSELPPLAAVDAGSPQVDAGPRPPPPPVPPVDAGRSYPPQFPAEECPPGSDVEFDDGGTPDGSIPLGLCIAVREVSGFATLNRAPVAGSLALTFERGNDRSQTTSVPDSTGHYQARAMRLQYEDFKFHPEGIFPTHQGPLSAAALDLSEDRTRDLSATSWKVEGDVSFGGVPWTPVSPGGDVQLGAFGVPAAQAVTAVSRSGHYQAALLEGSFGVGLAVPREALGATEILGYPVSQGMLLMADQTLDLKIPTQQLEGQLTLDGQPFPDRNPFGFDYQLEYVTAGAQRPVARSFHEGARTDFRAQVPRGKYAVSLNLEGSPDRSLPAKLVGKLLSASVDLTQDRTENWALTTVALEGAISVDGTPIPAAPNYSWFLYAYGIASGTQGPFIASYDVPQTQPAFSLRAFPATYYLALYVDFHFHPDLIEGWYLVSPQFPVLANTSLPIDIVTASFDGTLRIDGQPPPFGKSPGQLVLTGDTGTFRQKLLTAVDGSFHYRVPRGIYDVSFAIDPDTYPHYARGFQRMVSQLDLNVPQQRTLTYDTRAVSGPLRVGGVMVADTIPGSPEVGLDLRRKSDGVGFHWVHDGGSPNYVLRIPAGEYSLNFRIEPDAVPGVAWGTAPLGFKLDAR